MSTRLNRKNTITASVTGITLGVILALTPASTFAASANESRVSTYAAEHGTAKHEVPRAEMELINSRWKDDGVKGKVKNLTKEPIVVSNHSQQYRNKVVLNPGDELTYYDCREIERRNGTEIVYAGHGIGLTIERLHRRAGERTYWVTLVDPYVGRPDTSTEDKFQENVRLGWSEGVSHHENFRDGSLWVKRETDGWNGGYETKHTGDWAVFTIHVDRI